MSKKKETNGMENEEKQFDAEVQPTYAENFVSKIDPKDIPPKESTISPRLAGSKLRLRKKDGKTVLWTIEQALQQQNYAQLSDSSKNFLKGGKSVSSLVSDLGIS